MIHSDETPRVVVGIDGSPHSVHALREAVRFAKLLGARLELITAWSFQPTSADVFVDRGFFENTARKTLEDVATEVFDDDPPKGLSLTVAQGPPAKVLADASEGAALLVVGNRGHGGFTDLLLGSVGMACAQHATCPVLIVPMHREPPGHASRRLNTGARGDQGLSR
jgi:nucleotide-binding universal stress UspA family protein